MDEDEPINKFLNTYDKEYSMFFERIDKLRKSTSRERGITAAGANGPNNHFIGAEHKKNN